MIQKLVLAALLATFFYGITARNADAMAGRLRRPGIAIPSARGDGKLDATVEAMNRVFGEHEKQFVGGHFINAHSVLEFASGVRTINKLLDELSKIDGAELRVRLSKESGVTDMQFALAGEQSQHCDFTVDHNAWGNAHQVTITIYLSDAVKLEELELPMIHGRATMAGNRGLSPQ